MTDNKPLDLDALQNLRNAIDDVVGYLSDNSCSDPDCCGGPYYTEKDYESGLEVLALHGLTYAPTREQST